jgi:hypothetical protein
MVIHTNFSDSVFIVYNEPFTMNYQLLTINYQPANYHPIRSRKLVI